MFSADFDGDAARRERANALAERDKLAAEIECLRAELQLAQGKSSALEQEVARLKRARAAQALRLADEQKKCRGLTLQLARARGSPLRGLTKAKMVPTCELAVTLALDYNVKKEVIARALLVSTRSVRGWVNEALERGRVVAPPAHNRAEVEEALKAVAAQVALGPQSELPPVA